MKDIYLLSNSSHEGVKSLPMIDIKYLDFILDLSKYDALIFTSKNSVISLDKKHLWQNIPSYAISDQTANLIKQKAGNLTYTGTSRDGNEFAKEILPLLKDKKILYLRAKEVVSNLSDILKAGKIDLDEQIVYETLCKKYEKKRFKKNSIFIFTSPSTVECFFKSFNWNKSFKAVTIGETTAKALPKEANYFISKEKSIKSCIQLAKKLGSDV
jgi:uroporphyrinogen-III synthase